VNTTSGVNITWAKTLVQGNYTNINFTCQDVAGNSNTTGTYWLNVDTVAPTITWNWADANQTIFASSTTPCVTLNEIGNCTLHFNNTNTTNTTNGTSACWIKTGLATGNYTVNVTCQDTAGNSNISSNVWVYYTAVNTSINVHLNAPTIQSFVLPITSYTQNNVTPTNQSASEGVFEITNNLSSAIIGMAIKTNETINDCLTVFIDPTNALTTSSRYTITDSYTFIPKALAVNASGELWFALNLYYCPGGDLDFDLTFAGVI
jgi:hypothetical protein